MEQLPAMNPVCFRKMAHGDLAGLKELAFDYFNDTRRLMTGWLALSERGDIGRLREELHRCKGGASLFGLERLHAMIGGLEVPGVLESQGFDITRFERELSAAENAVVSFTDAP